ncbi:eukaryotic translation initiation factor 2B subunit 2 [Clavulina sp. PMI_390]|nr:eukaryotic translation initiation factor 2B subunit 2 [Clavulina sp. PMI_390]
MVRQIVGSRAAALETVVLLRQVVASARFSKIEELLKLVRFIGKRLQGAQPHETSVGGIIRKVMKVIREEAAGVAGNLEPSSRSRSAIPKHLIEANFFLRSPHMASPMPVTKALPDPFFTESSKKAIAMKPALIDAIQEVINELETVYENVAKNAREYIHPEEIVLTVGKSKTVEAFLKAASKDRKFSVIVAETAPSYSGREMAAALAAAKISTVLVPDSALFAVMSRVNKVVLGAHSIQKNGGVFSVAGSALAAMAARAHSTPVLICGGQFKLTPTWNAHQQYSSRDIGNPEDVLPSTDPFVPEDVDIINPWYDWISPEFIDVLVTNYGDHPPAYVYRYVTLTSSIGYVLINMPVDLWRTTMMPWMTRWTSLVRQVLSHYHP